jgi:hypothetical protein
MNTVEEKTNIKPVFKTCSVCQHLEWGVEAHGWKWAYCYLNDNWTLCGIDTGDGNIKSFGGAPVPPDCPYTLEHLVCQSA